MIWVGLLIEEQMESIIVMANWTHIAFVVMVYVVLILCVNVVVAKDYDIIKILNKLILYFIC